MKFKDILTKNIKEQCMLVFSDLDRSIIYSNKFLNTDVDYSNIEVFEGREISFVSKLTIDMIKQIQKRGLFIPATTRTLNQFNRIEFSKFGINFPWVITSNGGVILRNGEVLESWKVKLKEVLSKSKSIDEVVESFEKYKDCPGILKFRKAEELFFYLVVDLEVFKINMLQEFTDTLDTIGWKVFVSGRKIYFLPSGLTKENAVKYLAKEVGIETFYSIGDSLMDDGMLSLSDNPYTLKHGELSNIALARGFESSESVGMKGTEEILKSIIIKVKIGEELNAVKA